MNRCRCGHPKDSPDPHPCHAKGYACGKPAIQRFYNVVPYAHVAGMQMKLEVRDTWACDECWVEAMPLLTGQVKQEDFQWKDPNPNGADAQ